jgi:hypothetical protein
MLLAQSLLASQKFEDRYYEFTTTSITSTYNPQVRTYGGTVTIDWGDGNIETGLDCSTSFSAKEYQHTYSVAGSYTVRISTERNASFTVRTNSNGNFDRLTLSVTGSTKQRGRSWGDAFQDMTDTTTDGMPDVNTEHVTDMREAFLDVDNITSIPDYDTRNVTDFEDAFRDCVSLTQFPNIKLDSANDAQSIFYNCTGITSANMPTYNCPNLTNAYFMFGRCTNITTAPTLTNFAPSNVTGLFSSCSSLTAIPTLDLSNTTDISYLFSNCASLTSFPLTSLPSNITSISGLCQGLTQFTTFPYLDISNCTNALWLFADLTQNFTVPNWDYSNLNNVRYMFQNSSGLTDFNMPSTSTLNLNFSNITSLLSFFENTNITTAPNWDFSNITQTERMFQDCSNLTTLPSTLNFSSAQDVEEMFERCTSLVTIPSGITWGSITITDQLCNGCTSLANFPAGVFDTGTLNSSSASHRNQFTDCALTAQSIENILVSFNTNTNVVPNIYINGGTNAAYSTWSSTAIAAYNSLITKGTNIYYNT